MRGRTLLGLVLIATAAVATGPAAANDVNTCTKSSGDVAIAACERLLAAPKLSKRAAANLHAWRADHYRLKGEHDRALSIVQEGVRLDPTFANVYLIRGLVHGAKSDHDRAIADFTEALRRAPKLALGYSHRANAYNWKGDWDRALADANQALSLDPKLGRAYQYRGIAYYRKGENERAIADLSEGLRRSPNDSVVHHVRGWAYEKKNELDKALADFRTAIALDPNNTMARDSLKRVEQTLAGGAAAESLPKTAPPTPPPAAAVARPQPAPAASSAPAAVTTDGPRVALVVGNGAYRHATQLANPANDAADITGSLRKLGFEVVEGRDLDKRGTEDKLREFGRKLAGAKLALFFYAGHGMQVAGRNYLVPVDAKLERPGDLRLDTIDISDVLAQMEGEPRVNLVFLDACRDNPLARSLARSLGARSTTVGQGLAMIQSAIGTMIAYATQPDAVALDGTGRNSPFTTALLKHIGTPGADISTVMRRVRADVITATSQRQVPWDHSSLIGDVVLVR